MMIMRFPFGKLALVLGSLALPSESNAQFKKVGEAGLSTLNRSSSVGLPSDKASGARGTVATIIRFVKPMDLGEEELRGLAEFERVAGFYGAFAADPKAKVYGYFHDVHTEQAARSAAITRCERGGQYSCEVYAISLPKGVQSYGSRPVMNLSAQTEFDTGFAQAYSSSAKGAFAINGWGSFGWSTGIGYSLNQIRQDAINNCLENAQFSHRSNPNLINQGYVREADLLTCRLVWSAEP